MHQCLLTGKKEKTMTVRTPSGACVAILKRQGQKPKVLRLLKTAALYVHTFDKDKVTPLPCIEHQLYAKPL